jgi:hypothetical protein
MLGKLETGILGCITVTLVDGLVLARSAFHHSMKDVFHSVETSTKNHQQKKN